MSKTELAGYSTLAAQQLYTSSSAKQHSLGQKFLSSDGREFTYTKAGEELVTGDWYQTAVHVSNFVSMALVTDVAIGGNEVSVTLGGTAATLNQFEDGYLVVSKGTGLGQMFVIRSNTAQTDTSGTCVFTLDDKVRVALDNADSKITVIKNRFDSVVKWAVTQTGSSAGAAVFPVASGEYGYLQTGGIGAALSDSTATAAETTGISPSTTTAGAITKAFTTQETIVGAAQVVTVSAEVGVIRINV